MKTPLRRLLSFATGATLAVLLVLGVALYACRTEARAHLQSLAVLLQLDGQPVPGFLRPFASQPLLQKTFTLSTTQGPVQAALYTPLRQPNAPGLVIVHGVHHLGIQEPHLMVLARSMAACGLRVLTPDLPGLRDYQVSPASIFVIGDAAEWLAHATGRPVGLMGISFSGGLALMAAAKPQYSRDISFVFAVGAHASLPRVANFYATGQDMLPDGTMERVTPHEYGPLVLEYEHLEDFTGPADTEALRAALRERLYEDPAQEQALVAKFTPAQRAEYDRIIQVQQQCLPLARSSRNHAAEMDAVSPHGHLQGLRAPVFLLHGRGDNIIPFAESEWLAQNLPPGTLRALLITPLLSHVSTESDHRPGLLEEWRLVHLLALVLEEAERGPATK